MNPNSQRLLHQSATARAYLRGMVRINQHALSTSVLSFVLSVLGQLVPGRIRDALCQAMILKHASGVQLFEGDDPKLADDSTGKLVGEVFSPVGDAMMDMADCPTPFRPFRRALFGLREFALGLRKLLFIPAKEAGIADLLAGRECSETFQANIDPNALGAQRKRRRFDLAGEASVPVAYRIPANREGLDLAFYRSVLDDLDPADLREQQAMLAKGESVLLESEAVIPTIAAEARIAGFLARFHPSKEGLESQVDSFLDILQDLRIHLGKLRLIFLPGSEQFVGSVQRQRFLFLFPGVLASCQGFVIDPTTQFQRMVEQAALAAGWVQAKLVCFTHNCIIP